jgi:hypothetical protein
MPVDLNFQHELSRWADPYSRPVYFGSRRHGGYDLDINSGTGALVRLGGRYLGVTCHHVIAAYRERRALGNVEFFYFGEAAIEPETFLIDESKRLDLVTLDLGSIVGSGDKLQPTNFFEPRRWPPGEVVEGDVIAFVGFPAEWRQQTSRSDLSFGHLAQCAAEVESVADEHFCARIALDESTYIIRNEGSLAFAGGMSGAPVFVWRNGPVLTGELAGFVYEHATNFDLLFVRKANCITDAGMLLK